MKSTKSLLVVGLWLSFLLPSAAQNQVTDVLRDPTVDLNRPADRARAVDRIRAIENNGLQRARARANAMGLPMRMEQPNGTITEIVGLDENNEFLIYTTHNADAAISTSANLVHPSPYGLDGTGVTVGVWDGGAVRATHTEFQTATGSRVTIMDGAGLSNHGTHVAGTIGARGASISRKGMAPNVRIDSYDWNSDTSEMISRAASAPAQADKIPISNHSYGFITGWNWNGSNWQWYGSGTNQNGVAVQFGQYTSQAASWDSIAFNAPYYLIFKSAGNDNTNNPSTGSQVVIGGNLVTYDPAIHPPGDGVYRNGYENISHAGNSKNIMTVGAANDAVTSGQRDPAKSTLTNFSSRGPTDDGRIKPDIVANGASLSSTGSGGDTSYYSSSGTSMSSPNAAGSAALLVQLYRDLFPGDDMRASTLKGLIIHTATDLGQFGVGNPGPDYRYGWGLMDTKKAADLIVDHHANPLENRMVEAQLTSATPTQTFTFTWDGSSPIRATLCWTDPAGTATSTHDLRTPRLVNDLDLRVIAPDGTIHYPFVMPFVGTWTVESMALPATTGDNITDNVEQVLIENPTQPGTWTITVSHKGNLTNNQQHYSLLTSGLSAAPPSMAVTRNGNEIANHGVEGVSGAAVGSATALTYTISNVGGGQLGLTTPVSVGGQENCTVTITTQPSSTLSGGASTNLVANVTPTSAGAWSFQISITNDDEAKNPYTWTVTGLAGSTATTTFTAVADTYISSASSGENFGSATQLRLNNQTGGNPNNRLQMRGLVRFDLSSIPADTAINSATLQFVQDNTVSGSIDIAAATATWTESGATWNNSNGLIGSNLFGTANAPGSAGAALPAIQLNASGITAVQNWVNNPAANHGFGITATDSGNSQNWIALRSREHATEAHRPRLTLSYGGGANAPLMAVSGENGYLPSGASEFVADTVSGTATTLTYSIANFGDANLTLDTPLAVTATSNCTVSILTQPATTVAASASTELVLNLTPTSGGAWSATVSIANNDPGKNPYTWTITGSAFGSYTLTYSGNGNDTGTAPVDPASPYFEGATVTVLANTGGLAKNGFAFAGWNTTADGTGTTYAPGESFPMPGSAVTLHAVWNTPPTVDAGADQTLALTGGDWSPLSLEPGLWLDASDPSTLTLNGSAVSTWADKSGNNRHASQANSTNQPVLTAGGLHGKPVVTFDGSNDFFTVDLDFLAGVPHSAFIVTNPTGFSNIYGAANSSQGSNSLHVGFNGNNYRMNFWANDFGPARSANFIAGAANIVNYAWVTGVGKQIFANGKSEGSNTNAGNIGTMSGGGRIGHTTTAGHAAFGGDIAEIIIIPSVLSTEDRQKIEGYLAHKWALTGNLATNHPYRDDPPDGAFATAALTGTASDIDGDPLATQWTLLDGPFPIDLANPAALATTATFVREGTYTLRLTADDGFSTSFDEITITITPPPTAYQQWAVEYQLDGESADLNAVLHPDGLTNLQRFAFGLSPVAPTFNPVVFDSDGSVLAVGVPTLHNLAPPGMPDDERAVFLRRRDHQEVGLVYTVHFSADLKAWHTSQVIPTIHTDPGDEGDYEVVSVPFPLEIPVENGGPPQPARFMHVTVSMD